MVGQGLPFVHNGVINFGKKRTICDPAKSVKLIIENGQARSASATDHWRKVLSPTMVCRSRREIISPNHTRIIWLYVTLPTGKHTTNTIQCSADRCPGGTGGQISIRERMDSSSSVGKLPSVTPGRWWWRRPKKRVSNSSYGSLLPWLFLLLSSSSAWNETLTKNQLDWPSSEIARIQTVFDKGEEEEEVVVEDGDDDEDRAPTFSFFLLGQGTQTLAFWRF